MHPTTRTRAAVALAASLLLVPAACADDESDAGAASTSSTSSTTAAPSTEEPPVVEVSAVDFGFEDLPEEVSAGTRLTLVNTSEVELHELVAARLPDGEDRDLEELVHLPQEELMALIGQPATVLLAAPGGDVIPAVGDGTLSEPGRYLLLCFIPTGVDPAEYLAAAEASGGAPPQVAGGPPHLAHGMYAELSVS